MENHHVPNSGLWEGKGSRRIDYKSELNEQQYNAVVSTEKQSLVIAGAGAGKTRTLIYRVAWLLENGCSPYSFLLLTFTNKAAKEMTSRVQQLLGFEGSFSNLMTSGVWSGTFHSIGCRILRQYADRAGLKKNFSILDRSDSKELISSCVTDLKIEKKGNLFPKADVLVEMFSHTKNFSLSLTEVIRRKYARFLERFDEIESVYNAYTQKKQDQSKLDFDDLIVLPCKLLKENADIRDHYRKQFRYILVDEYQDTNLVQNEFIELLAGDSGNLMVVGDDAQSIYSWRGANFRNILEFEERYPEAKRYFIETNYRSTQSILDVANASIANNKKQFQKNLKAIRPSVAKPFVVACTTGYEQAEFVTKKVAELHDSGIPLNKMAVLYRAHNHAMELQMELKKEGIPFRITSGIRFFEQAHIKDITSFLRIAYSPADEVAFKRIVKMLPGVGETTVNRLWKLFAGDSWPESLTDGLMRCDSKISAKSRQQWALFVDAMKAIDPVQSELTPSQMIENIMDSYFEDVVLQTYENAETRIDEIHELAHYSEKFGSLEEFLSDMALQSNLDGEIGEGQNIENQDLLNLSTIHQAKGLEYDVVFLIMLTEGMFPSIRSMESDDQMEEERRLFYVAVTRAKSELYLLYPEIRRGWGGNERQIASRFLEEVPKDFFEELNLLSDDGPYGYYSGRQRDMYNQGEAYIGPDDEPF